MTLVVILILAQSAVFGAVLLVGSGMFLSRIEALTARIGQLEDALARALEARAPAPRRAAEARREAAMAEAGPRVARRTSRRVLDEPPIPENDKLAHLLSRTPPSLDPAPPVAETQNARPAPPLAPVLGGLSPETMRALATAAALASPSVAAAFGASAGLLIAAIFVLVAAAFAISARPAWRAAAWTGALAGGAWTIVGVATGAAAAEPALFSGATLLAGWVGLVHARLSVRTGPGVVLALFMAAGALTLGATTSLASVAGISFAGVVLAAAVIGAAALKLEFIHLAAFAGAGGGLYVLSGQAAGEFLFTPAAALAGAVFGALAAVRAPSEGARGASVAMTGVVAPIFAVGALINARHGLDAPWQGVLAYAALTVVFAFILVAASRRQGRMARLKLTAWALGLGAAWSASAATLIAIAPAFGALKASALSLLALAVIAIDGRRPARLWRFIAFLLFAAVAFEGGRAAAMIGYVATPLPALASLAGACAAPALMAGLGAYWLRSRAPFTAGALETGALIGAGATLSGVIRFAFSGEALWLAPLTFAECGIHAAAWLLLSLAITSVEDKGSQPARRAAALLFAAAGVAAPLLALALLGLGYWDNIDDAFAGPGLHVHAPIGLAAAALAALAHWVFHVRRETAWRAHAARTTAAFLGAGWVTMEAAAWGPEGGALTLGLGALSFAAAFAIAVLPLRTNAEV